MHCNNTIGEKHYPFAISTLSTPRNATTSILKELITTSIHPGRSQGMGSAGPSSTQSALLDLERSAALPAELLDEAARILGVEFSEIEDELLSASAETKPRRSIVFAAKEEWVLRWLLKKTKPGARTTSPGSVLESSASEDPRKWLLFYYLVQKTPIKKIAKIIRDHDAMKQIQHALGQLVKTQKAPSSTNAFFGTQRSASSSSR